MNYLVLTSEDKDIEKASRKLTESVHQNMRYGWKPQGGVSVTTKQNNFAEHPTFHLAQAMVLE